MECEHYVLGGWNYYPGKNEITYLNYLNISLLLIIIFVFGFKKLKNSLWLKST